MRISLSALLSLPVLLCAACANAPDRPSWEALRSWGSLREALRDGKADGRVALASLDSSQLYGVGAPAGLDGEITLRGGDVLVSRVRGAEVRTGPGSDAQATILFAGVVREWRDIEVREDVSADEFESFLAARAKEFGWDGTEPIPFTVRGELIELDVHVLAGECPIRARILRREMTTPPLRRSYDRVRGELVGIYAADAAGVITHHGEATHVHAVLGGQDPWTGHCDSVGIGAGSVLRVPRRGEAPSTATSR